MEYFRFITPILITITLFMIGNIDHKINQIDDKLFKHLTNDELHAPRSIVITKPEFSVYQEWRNKQMDSIDKSVCEIKESIKEHIRQTSR